ncbi:MAG: hypothetical protein Q9214_005363, partial [Letrouitia sp. 1 TL-2023]
NPIVQPSPYIRGLEPFDPPNIYATPFDLFKYSNDKGAYFRQTYRSQALVYVAVELRLHPDDSPAPYAGYGWSMRPNHGPSGRWPVGQPNTQEGSRLAAKYVAGIKAAIMAMSHDYASMGFGEVVIATHNPHLIHIFEKLEEWKRWGWRSSGNPHSMEVGSKDLVVQLDEKLNMQRDKGVQITFWRIREMHNLAMHLTGRG